MERYRRLSLRESEELSRMLVAGASLRVAGQRRSPAKCAGGRLRADIDPVGQSSGTGHIDEQANRRACRRGATQSRQWHAPRETHRVGWTRPGSRHALYECHCCRPIQSGDSRLLSAFAASGQSEEGGPHRLHAEIPDRC